MSRVILLLTMIISATGCEFTSVASADDSQSGSLEEAPALWTTYRNREYQFEIQHPRDWIVRDDFSIEIRPIITLAPDEADLDKALTQHASPQLAYISIFPRGGASEAY